MAKSDPTLQDPNCVFQLLKKHVDRYTPEMVEKVCGTPKDTFLKVAEVVTSTGNARARRNDHVRARMDAAFDRRADDPHGRDAAAPPRKRRAAGRRRQRAARTLQHPGSDRHGRDLRDPPGLPEDADGRVALAQGIQRRERAEGARPVDELLAELSQVHGLASEILLRQGGDEGKRFRIRLAAQDRRELLLDVHLRRHVPRQLHARRRQGAGTRRPHHVRNESRGNRPELAEDDRAPFRS